MKQNKKITYSILILLICSIVALSGIGLINTTKTFAVENSAGQNSQTDINCTLEMKPFLAQKTKEFIAYLKIHFQNKSTNSSLLEAALLKYKQYETEIYNKYYTYFPQSGLSIATEIEEQLQCKKVVDEEIRKVKELLKRYVIRTNQIKVTSALQTKLAEINKKLSDLDKQFTLMLGKYKTLSNRLPCYVKQCLN